MIAPAYAELRRLLTLKPRSEWHEDDGSALWWSLPVNECPYAGTPLDDDFPEYMTHWSPLPEVWNGADYDREVGT